MKENNKNVSIKEATDELMETSIFNRIAKRNGKNFAQKLAIWLVRYVLIASSMNEALKINLEKVLLELHGNKLQKIISVTEKTFHTAKEDTEKYDTYIW